MLNGEQREYLLKLARSSIRDHLKGARPESQAPDDDVSSRACGAFVTLKQKGRLRGCIGNIRSSDPLHETVSRMAVAAASEDPRFPPMHHRELDATHIEISVLSPMQKITNPESVVVGEHGLYIRRGHLSGLLLPQVPVEWGWDRETFLRQTCRKAGLPDDAWKDPETEIHCFSAEVFGEDA